MMCSEGGCVCVAGELSNAVYMCDVNGHSFMLMICMCRTVLVNIHERNEKYGCELLLLSH